MSFCHQTVWLIKAFYCLRCIMLGKIRWAITTSRQVGHPKAYIASGCLLPLKLIKLYHLLGENGKVHYTIRQSNPGNVFDVNMTSGEIYSALPVDYESQSEHWLVVQAVDSSLEDPQGTNINVTVSLGVFICVGHFISITLGLEAVGCVGAGLRRSSWKTPEWAILSCCFCW